MVCRGLVLVHTFSQSLLSCSILVSLFSCRAEFSTELRWLFPGTELGFFGSEINMRRSTTDTKNKYVLVV